MPWFVFPKINAVNLAQGNSQTAANLALGTLFANQVLGQSAGNSADIHQR